MSPIESMSSKMPMCLPLERFCRSLASSLLMLELTREPNMTWWYVEKQPLYSPRIRLVFVYRCDVLCLDWFSLSAHWFLLLNNQAPWEAVCVSGRGSLSRRMFFSFEISRSHRRWCRMSVNCRGPNPEILEYLSKRMDYHQGILSSLALQRLRNEQTFPRHFHPSSRHFCKFVQSHLNEALHFSLRVYLRFHSMRIWWISLLTLIMMRFVSVHAKDS